MMKMLPIKAAFLFYQMGDQLCQRVGHGFVALTGQVHAIDVVEFTAQLLCVQKVAADQIALLLVVAGQLPGR